MSKAPVSINEDEEVRAAVLADIEPILHPVMTFWRTLAQVIFGTNGSELHHFAIVHEGTTLQDLPWHVLPQCQNLHISNYVLPEGEMGLEQLKRVIKKLEAEGNFTKLVLFNDVHEPVEYFIYRLWKCS